MQESRAFSEYKKKQYLNLYSQFEFTLENIASSDYLSDLIDRHLITTIKELSEGELANLSVMPKSYALMKLGQLNNKIFTTLSNRFYISIEKLWSNAYELGKQHTILDLLYAIKPYRKYLDSLNPIKSITNLLNNISFSNAILDLQNKDNIAEFAENISESRILRAKRTEIVLRNNYNKLEDQGFFDDIFNNSDIVAYLSVADRVTFYETINRIYDYKQKAKATDSNFLANNYMKNRYRVLARDYAKNYDTKVKELIYEYLAKDIENVKQIKGTINRAEKLSQDVFRTLNKASISKKQDPITKQKLLETNFKASKTIVRTELNLAYNFGKLSGFTSPYDLNRKFRWNASWELEYKNPYYEVCDYCASMDGKEFTVADLLFVGTQLDYGIMKYKGTPKTKTSFKNPLLPMISAHPNCFVDGTFITMYDTTSKMYYYKNISTVNIGDYVAVPTPDKFKRVVKLHKNWYGEQIFKIRTNTGQTIDVTGDHPIWNGFKWKLAKHFTVGEHIYISALFNQQGQSLYNGAIFSPKINSSDISKSKPFQSFNHESIRPLWYKENSKREQRFICKYNRKSSKILFTDDRKQSHVQSRYQKENDENAYITTQTSSTLQKSYGKRALQIRVQSRFKSIFSKFLGSEYSENIESIKLSMGIRKNNRISRRHSIQTRFLFDRLGFIYRSKGVLYTAEPKKGKEIYSGKASVKYNNPERETIQRFEDGFQGLNSIRIVSIESYMSPQYVYNITVEDTPVYFANDILVHNCSCFYTLVEEDPEEYEKRSETKAPINIDELRDKRLNNYDIERLYRQKPSNGLLESSLALAGTGLLVGGIFLLSRSNVFKSFYQVSRDYFRANPSIAKTIINETLENSPKEIITKTKDVYKTVKNIDLELGKITQDIIKNAPDLRVDMSKIDLSNIKLPDTTL